MKVTRRVLAVVVLVVFTALAGLSAPVTAQGEPPPPPPESPPPTEPIAPENPPPPAQQPPPETPPTQPETETTIEARPVDDTGMVVVPVRRGGSDYRIGRQDLLEIHVFDLKELDQTVRVADDGAITLPLLGRLEIAGMTKGDLEKLIAARLEERYVRNPQVTIFVKEYESKKVAVSGAVKKPDTYEMLGGKTLLEMISMAGGLDKDLGKEIFIFRQNDDGSTSRIAIDLERLVYDADPALNVEVLPGDIIYVPTIQKIRIFVSGAVKSPNLYEVPRAEPVTVLKAVTLAGGATDRASETHVQIIRTADGGERSIIEVNLKKIKRGKAEDVVLQKDDLVLVPESVF
jgi:polysaccharide export outer membrane protein